MENIQFLEFHLYWLEYVSVNTKNLQQKLTNIIKFLKRNNPTPKNPNTEWFKINLTLFKTHFSQGGKYKELKTFTKCDMLGGCGKSDIKIDVVIMKWESFSDKKPNTIWHTHKVCGGVALYCGIIIDSNAHSMIDQNINAL